MRRVKKIDGWDEVTTVKIRITQIYRNFSTSADWKRIHEENPSLARNRKTCKCCGSKWADNNSDVALAFTNKGNKIICQTCTDYYEDQGVKIFIQDKKK
jgi:hypothetical protein